MQRDMELIRTILLKVEADPTFDGSVHQTDAAALGITDHSDDEVLYHLVLLIEAGLLDGKKVTAGSFPPSTVAILRLTWQGHEFLDSVRDPDIWHKTKQRAATVTGVGLAFLWAIAKAEV